MKILDSIVKEMLLAHKGGEVFFDHLDEAVKKDTIIKTLFDKFNLKNKNIIVSGGFGNFFINNYGQEVKTVISVNGSLRKGEPIQNLEYLREEIKGNSFSFVDDSFYSGKTRDVVKAEIERLGGIIAETVVIYDGSKIKEENVKSLYRYY